MSDDQMGANGDLPPAPETTLVVVLGASTYPRKPAWTNPVLCASARAVLDYVVSPEGLAVPVPQVLDLFDDPSPAVKQCEGVEAFLRDPRFRAARDLIVYYVGHGGFDVEEYYLAVRDTANNREFLTAIESRKLARIILESFARRRVYVILDSCFAASAASDWQGSPLDLAVKRMSRPLPRRGTAFLAAASKDDVALAPRAGSYTMFTGALLGALQHGIPGGDQRLSLYELYELIRDTLNEQSDAEGPRPHLHAPKQDEGDISLLPMFPNSSYRDKPIGKRIATNGQVASSSRPRRIGRWIATAVVVGTIGAGMAIFGVRGDGSGEVAAVGRDAGSVAMASARLPDPTRLAEVGGVGSSAEVTARPGPAKPAETHDAGSNAPVAAPPSVAKPAEAGDEGANAAAPVAGAASETTVVPSARKAGEAAQPDTPAPIATIERGSKSPRSRDRTRMPSASSAMTSPRTASGSAQPVLLSGSATAPMTADPTPEPPASPSPRCSKADFAAVYDAAVPAPGAVRAALRNLKLCRDAGAITDAEFDRYQTALVAKL